MNTTTTDKPQRRVFSVEEVDHLIPSLSTRVGELLIARRNWPR